MFAATEAHPDRTLVGAVAAQEGQVLAARDGLHQIVAHDFLDADRRAADQVIRDRHHRGQLLRHEVHIVEPLLRDGDVVKLVLVGGGRTTSEARDGQVAHRHSDFHRTGTAHGGQARSSSIRSAMKSCGISAPPSPVTPELSARATTSSPKRFETNSAAFSIET